MISYGIDLLPRKGGSSCGAHAAYTTLLMSTGLTFGTIASLFGLQAGILNRAQFSLLIATVILSAILPTLIAQHWFDPRRFGIVDEPAREAIPGAG